MKGTIFIQDWGTFREMQTLVVCGMDTKKAAAWMKKNDVKPDFIEHFVHFYSDVEPTRNGSVMHHQGATMLWLPEWENDWDHAETLMHEIMHLIYFVMIKHMSMDDETDAHAYQQVYLFRNIRQRLEAHLKRNSTKRRKNDRKPALKKGNRRGNRRPRAKS